MLPGPQGQVPRVPRRRGRGASGRIAVALSFVVAGDKQGGLTYSVPPFGLRFVYWDRTHRCGRASAICWPMPRPGCA
eukprot:11204538-Lingulodinium_polyedra.AAC.1